MIETLTFQLDRERHLRLDMNALALFERTSGRSALDPATWIAIRATDITALIWAAVVAHEQSRFLLEGKTPPDDLDVPSLDQLRAMIDGSRLMELRRVLDDAWGIFFPADSAEDDAEDPPGA